MASMYKRQALGGGNIGKYSCLHIPEDVLKAHKLNEGKIKNRINILQFRIGSKNHPLVASGDLKIGMPDWQLNWFEHRNVGPDQKTMMCLKRTYGHPCPACEARQALKDQGFSNESQECKALSATERSAFVIQSVSQEGVAELTVLNVSTYLFTTKLLTASENDDMVEQFPNGQVEFAEFGTDGRIIQFNYNVVGEGKGKKVSYESLTFKVREDKNMIPKISMLEDIPSLDSYLKVCTYAEFNAAFNAEGAEAEVEEEEAPTPAPKPKPAPAPVKKAVVEDPDDVPVISEDPDEPVSKAKPTPAKKAVVEDEFVCPMSEKGGVFGKNCDDYDKCLKCPCYDECAAKMKDS